MTGRIGVVIPAWNGLRYLRDCVASVRAQDVDVHLVVVDNGSVDGTGEWLAGQRDVDVISHAENRGFAVAVNAGVAVTTSEAVLVLNADATLAPDCARRLAAALAADPGLGGAQPRIRQIGEPAGLLYSVGQRMLADGRAFEDGAGEPDGPAFDVAREVFGVCGAACLLRRELFTDLGGYDERYFAFHEDVDLNARARLAGWRFAYVPAALADHHGNAVWRASAARPDDFNVRLVARNRLATDIKLLPARFAARALVAETGSLVRNARRGTLGAALRGRGEALRWTPALLRDRRRLRAAGDPAALEGWLDRGLRR